MVRQSYSLTNKNDGHGIRMIALSLVGGVVIIGIVFSYSWLSKDIPTRKCHKTFEGAINHLCSKTPFISNSSQLFVPKGCMTKMIWLLVRHGTRNPTDHDIQDMISILPGLQQEIIAAEKNGLICKPELEELKSWKLSQEVNLSRERWLVEQGYKDMTGVAKRFSHKFPHLFPKRFSNQTYLLWASPTQRTLESREAFAKAIFASNQDVYFPEPIHGDPLLEYSKTCHKYVERVKKNPETLVECRKFEETSHFRRMLANVGKHTGLERNLTAKEALLMYKVCALEWAQHPLGNPAPWCAVFDENDFKVLEYYNDMELYWEKGYGNPVTYEQSCTLVQDVAQRMRKNSTSPATTAVYFGHDDNILETICRLGLFHDAKPLTSENFDEYQHHREWRTSTIAKYASSLAFLLFHCSQESNPYQVATFFQEKPIKIPACNNKWTCPLDTFLENLKPIADNCDLAHICMI